MTRFEKALAAGNAHVEQRSVFRNYCTCGGFAWTMNGRNPEQPHMAWCPQLTEYAQWWRSLPVEEQKKIAERSAKG